MSNYKTLIKSNRFVFDKFMRGFTCPILLDLIGGFTVILEVNMNK